MIARLALALAALSPRAVAALELDAREETPAALVVLAPGNQDAGLEARLLEAVRKGRPIYGIVPAASLGIDPGALSRCSPTALLACVVERFDGKAPELGAVILASVLPQGPGRAVLRALVIDVPRARAILAEPRGVPEDEAALEDRLFRQVHEGPPTPLDPRDALALGAAFEALLAELPRTFSGAQPLGSIAIESARAYRELSLDGRSLGPLPAGASTITSVRPGPRVLRAIGEAQELIELGVEVRSDRVASVRLQAEVSNAAARADYGAWWTGLTWTGVGALAAGAALVGVAAGTGGDVQALCLVRDAAPDASCAALGSPGFGFDAGATPTADRERVNPSGVTPLALGAALAGAGLGWAVGSLLLGDAAEHPWWVLGAGLALGAAGFALGAAAAP